MNRRSAPLSLLALLTLCASPALGGGSLESISHRDKLYDIARHGDALFAVGYPGLLLRSTDRGGSWSLIEVETDDALFAVDLAADGSGMAVGRSGLVLVTKDGGKTWKRASSGVKEHLFDVAALGNGKAVAVGHFGTAIRTENHGKDWTRLVYDIALPPLPGDATTEGDEADGGISAAEEENEGAAEEARLNAIAFTADGRRGWIVGEFGLILHSMDGGQTWKRQRNPAPRLLHDVIVVAEAAKADDAPDAGDAGATAARLIAVGAEGLAIETRDGGAAWMEVKTGTAEHLFGAAAVGDREFLVGANGTLLLGSLTKDGLGSMPVGVFTWLTAGLFLDERNGFLVGGRGHLMQTADGGATWQRLAGR